MLRTHPSIYRPARFEALQAPRKAGLLRRAYVRLFKRPDVTTFHRCFALHMHVAAQRSALD